MPAPPMSRPAPRFETRAPMLLAGLRGHHDFATAGATTAAAWARFAPMRPLPGQVGRTAYGAMCGTDLAAGRFEYMCAVEVEGFDALPPGLGRMRVPQASYAVFTHAGHVSTLWNTWAAIWRDWLPTAGVTPRPTPDFELYGEAFDPATGEGGVEIWFPVEG